MTTAEYVIAKILPQTGGRTGSEIEQREGATGMGKAMVRADCELNRRGTGPIHPEPSALGLAGNGNCLPIKIGSRLIRRARGLAGLGIIRHTPGRRDELP